MSKISPVYTECINDLCFIVRKARDIVFNFKYGANRSISGSKSKVLTIFLKIVGESCHSVFSFKDLDIKSAIVFCLPGIWTADIQIFFIMHRSKICSERSLHFSEKNPPMLFTYAMAVVLSGLISICLFPLQYLWEALTATKIAFQISNVYSLKSIYLVEQW